MHGATIKIKIKKPAHLLVQTHFSLDIAGNLNTQTTSGHLKVASVLIYANIQEDYFFCCLFPTADLTENTKY
jgi:hypothetical protein